MAEDVLLVIGVGTVVEWLGYSGVVSQEVRDFEVFGESL